ncbi:MAG: ComF family protein [Candidatus Babeliales bacterium]|nr:ComF family protein [Candidatus Babeliales bacterium]
MLNILNEIFEQISYILSPPYCASCRETLKQRTILCKSCFAKITPVTSIDIKINAGYVIKVIAISDYKEPLRSLILAKKSSNYLASKQLGQLVWQMTNVKNLDFDYIVPIPLHWTRQITRGYNQVEVIAQVIAKECNKPLSSILKRQKFTKYQLALNKDERAKNLKNAFKLKKINSTMFQEKHILIVDDLFTTGSTLINAANELIKLKPTTITAVVVCRVT